MFYKIVTYVLMNFNSLNNFFKVFNPQPIHLDLKWSLRKKYSFKLILVILLSLLLPLFPIHLSNQEILVFFIKPRNLNHTNSQVSITNYLLHHHKLIGKKKANPNTQTNEKKHTRTKIKTFTQTNEKR